MIGIYKVTSPNGKVYIGQSVNIRKRFLKYKRNNCKTQIRLYNSLVKYGHENHTFEVIENCNVEDLNKKERYWQDFFNSLSPNGLNLKLTGYDDVKYFHSDETKIKISKSGIGRIPSKESLLKRSIAQLGDKNHNYGKPVSDIVKQKISKSTTGSLNHFYNKKHSEHSKLKISKANSGRILSEDLKNRISLKMKKHIKSEEHKIKIGLAHKGRKQDREVVNARAKSQSKIILNVENGIYYYGYSEASESINMKCVTLKAKLLGRNKNNTNFLKT